MLSNLFLADSHSSAKRVMASERNKLSFSNGLCLSTFALHVWALFLSLYHWHPSCLRSLSLHVSASASSLVSEAFSDISLHCP